MIRRDRIQTLLFGAVFAIAIPSAATAQTIAWKNDYSAVRREATEKSKPIFLEFSTENCVWCRKLEATTLRDQAVITALADRYICMKVDGDRNATLVNALNVTTYPTIVLANVDGKILTTLEGYQEADKLLEQLNHYAPASPAPDWMVRDYQEAARAIAISDYGRAIILLKGMVKEGGERPIQAKARTTLTDLESQAKTQLALARLLNTRGRSQEAVDVLTDLLRSYSGTQAATESVTLMASLSSKPEVREGLRIRKAREILAQAKDEYRGEQFLSCMERCETLKASYSDLAEYDEAKQLVGSISENPEYLAKACEALNQRSAAMYFALAESWLKRNQTEQAIVCLERVVQTAPNSRQADAARERITQLQKLGASSSSAYRPAAK